MLVALFSLMITLLFGGNEMDYYMISSLDKGIKQCVVDQNEKQEVKKLLKIGQSETKAYYKVREHNVKQLKKLLVNKKTSTEQFNSFEESQLKELIAYQDLVFETRIKCLTYITEEEWNCIVINAEKHTLKDKKKIAKTNLEDPFRKVELYIEKEMTTDRHKKHILESLKELEKSYADLLDIMAQQNEIDQEKIRKYSTTSNEFQEIASEINSNRRAAFNNLVKFHHDVAPLTDAKQWEAIAKRLSKVVLG